MERLARFIPRHGKPPLLLEIRSSVWFITLTVCVAIFSDIFLYGVIVPVIPFSLEVRSGVPHEDVQHWVSILLAVYSAAFLVSAPVSGWIADRTDSRQATMLAGLAILAGSTILLCVGKSLNILLAGRVIQGAAAGLTWTVALALLSDTIEKNQSGQALGYVAIAYSLGVLFAPFLGGIVYERSGYYSVFAMSIGIILVEVFLRVAMVEKKKAAKWLAQSQKNSASEGAPAEVKTETILQTQETQRPVQADTPDQVPTSKRKLPTMLILLKSRRIQAAFWGNFVGSVSVAVFDATLALFVNRVFGWGPLGAGLIFIPLILPSFAGPLIGWLCDKYGPRWLAGVGLMSSLPFWVLLRLIEHDTIGQIVLLNVLMVLLGAALALILTSLMTEFSKVCDVKEEQNPELFGKRSAYAQSYAIFNIAWAAGTLVGPLWAAGVEYNGGWKTLTWTIGLLNGVAAVPVVLFSGGPIKWLKWRRRERSDIVN